METCVRPAHLALVFLLGSSMAAAATSGLLSEHMPRLTTPEQARQAELDAYARDVLRRITANQRYPSEALARALEGAARVDMVVGIDGRVKTVRLIRSTGHNVLDIEALDKVRLLRDLPAPPRFLKGREFSLAVPVVFRIDEWQSVSPD